MTSPPADPRGVLDTGVSTFGGATGTRTPDLLHAMQALFQLSYSPARRRSIAGEGARPDPPTRCLATGCVTIGG